MCGWLRAGIPCFMLTLLLALAMPGRVADIVPETSRLAITNAAAINWELYAVSIDGGPVKRLTNDALQNAHPRVSPDGRWLLYEQQNEARKDEGLFLRSTSSPTGRLLAGITWATFTPDSRLLFTENIPDAKGKPEPWFGVMACDGTGKRLYRQGISPVMSPDGKLIAFKDLQGNMLLISADGKSEAVSLGKGGLSAFNRDGSLLAVSREYRVGNNSFTLPAVHVLAGEDAGKVYELPEAERRNREVCWGFVPDGRLLCTRDGEGIFLTDPQRHTLIWVTRGDDWGPELAPNGTILVFNHLRGLWGQLCRVNLDGTHFAPITSGLVDTPNYTITPDGKTVLFSALPHQGYDAATLVTRKPFTITPYPPAVFKRDGIGMVPLRYLAEQIGAEVSWDAFRKRAIVTRQGKTYSVTPPAAPDRTTFPLVLSVFSTEDETLYVPVRELIEALGGTVTVAEGDSSLSINLPGFDRPMTMPIVENPSLIQGEAPFLFSLDGASRQRLTFNTMQSGSLPLVSPDGQWLVMPGSRTTTFTGRYDIFAPAKSGMTIRHADDPTERRLLPQLPDGSGYSEPVFAPDGTALLFTREIEVRTPITGGGPGEPQGWRTTYRDELGLVTLADGTVRELGAGREAVYNPDGTRIAFARDDQVWVMRSDGADAHKVCAGFAPHFTPDGARLVVHRMRDEMTADERAAGINASLVLCRLDGTEERRLRVGTLAGFSADGNFLYAWEARLRPEDRSHQVYQFPQDRIEYTSLRRLSLDTQEQGKVVFTGAFQEVDIGATHAAGLSRKNGYNNGELYAAPLAGGPARLLAKGPIRSPRFTPDGQNVLFIKGTDVCLVNADGGDVAQVTWGVGVCDYTITPDGDHLLVYGGERE